MRRSASVTNPVQPASRPQRSACTRGTGTDSQGKPTEDATLCGPLTRLRGPSITSIDPGVSGGLRKGSEGAGAHGGDGRGARRSSGDCGSSPHPGSQRWAKREQQPLHFLLRRLTASPPPAPPPPRPRTASWRHARRGLVQGGREAPGRRGADGRMRARHLSALLAGLRLPDLHSDVT
jgi:hypothetical protein